MPVELVIDGYRLGPADVMVEWVQEYNVLVITPTLGMPYDKGLTIGDCIGGGLPPGKQMGEAGDGARAEITPAEVGEDRAGEGWSVFFSSLSCG